MAFNLFYKRTNKVKSEKDLIDLAKKDSRYFAPVYKKYHEPIFRFVYQRMDSQADASDITSQVFLKALLNLPKYQHKGYPFSSWLYKIALNEVNQFYRGNNKSRTVNVDETQLKEVVEETDQLYDQDKQNKLIKALSQLKEDKLNLIEMRFFEKRSFKEIASILGITENNAKVKTYRALDEVKKMM